MLDEVKEPLPPVDASPEEAELEFRPWVKWAAAGILAGLCVGLGWATFSLGYHQGYTESAASGRVQASLNELAAQNLRYFLQLSAADDATLVAHATRPEHLAWIEHPEILREARWLLAEQMLERKLYEPAIALLDDLYKGKQEPCPWAERAETAAYFLALGAHTLQAKAYYRQAVRLHAQAGNMPGRVRAFRELAIVEINTAGNPGEYMASLEALLKECADMGEAARSLQHVLLVHKGICHREQGENDKAAECFAAVLEGAEPSPATAWEAAYLGAAMVEQGQYQQAESLLWTAVTVPTNAAEGVAQVLALRYLSVIREEQGNIPAALGLLNRAEGVASTYLYRRNPFLASLAIQRGWLSLVMEDFETASAAFEQALAHAQSPTQQVQALEGVARCRMVLGKVEEAPEYLKRCLDLRKSHFTALQADMGRCLLLMAQVAEQLGKPQEAASAYAEAIPLLRTELSAENKDNLIAALTAQGILQFHLSHWEASLSAWKELLPLVQDQPDRREEARQYMRQLAPHVSVPPAESTSSESSSS